MSSKFTYILAAALVASTFASLPAFSDDGDGRHRDNQWHKQGWDNRNGYNQAKYVSNHHDRDWRDNNNNNRNWRDNDNRNNRNHHHVNSRVNNWDQERNLYRSNWGRMSNSQRQAMNPQMHQQWLAYHQTQVRNNTYNNQQRWNSNNNNDWNTYSDPQFIDYLHNSSPSMLNQIRSYLKF